MLPQLEQICAKHLAMNAYSYIAELADALVSPAKATPDLTGWLVHAMGGIYERAILTSPDIPSDQAVAICEKFFPEYAQVVKLTLSTFGTSNPLKKLLFNATFGRMFGRQSSDIRANIRTIWDRSREDSANPLEYLAAFLIVNAQSSTGSSNDSDERISTICQILERKFSEVHSNCR